MLKSHTALRVFPGGETCEVEIPEWTDLDGNLRNNVDWNDAFTEIFQHQVGHGSVAGFVISVRPGQGT